MASNTAHSPPLAPPATNASDQADLASVEDGLFGDFDISLSLGETTSASASTAPIDPKEARLEAAFQRARKDYTVKIEDEAWFLPSSSSLRDADGNINVARFRVPSPTEMRQARIQNKRQSLDQEWTVDYLYSIGRFDLALAYATSFIYSMDLPLPFDLEGCSLLEPCPRPRHSSAQEMQQPKTVTRAARKATEAKGPTKEMLDTGLRCVMALVRQQRQPTSSDPTLDPLHFAVDVSITAWVPRTQPSPVLDPPPSSLTTNDNEPYHLSSVSVRQLSLAFLSTGYTEVRRGAGDHLGYRNIVIPYPHTSLLKANYDRLKLQNWTIFPGLALSLGQLGVEMGLYRLAVESLTLFLASRGPQWRGLLPCAFALSKIINVVAAGDSDPSLRTAMEELVKALTVVALQSAPRRRRNEMARLVLEGRILNPSLVDSVMAAPLATGPPSLHEANERDRVRLDTLLRKLTGTVLAEEIIVALCNVVCQRKGGVTPLAYKLRSYLDNSLRDAGNEDEAEEEQGQTLRSVRTL